MPSTSPESDLPFELTPRAIEMGKRKLEELGEGAVGIRIGVKGGGCNGLSYVFDFARKIRPGKDLELDFGGLTLVCDGRSIEHLRGSCLEWSDELVNHGFRWKNPNATGTCGCGDSFSTE